MQSRSKVLAGLVVVIAGMTLFATSPRADTFDERIETLSEPGLFPREFQEHKPLWLASRIDTLLKNCVKTTDADRRTILIHLIAQRYGELLVSKEGPMFLNEIPVSKYISIHKELTLIEGSDDPKRVSAIEHFMVEYWPHSQGSLDTARKFVYILGLLQQHSSEAQPPVNVEILLEDYRTAHSDLRKMPLKQLANHFFYYISSETVTGAVTLTPTEYTGLTNLVGYIRDPFSPSSVSPAEICNYFLKF